MSMLSLLEQLSEIDVKGGYQESSFDKFPDGQYEAIVEDITFKDNQESGKGYLFTIKYNILPEMKNYMQFINLNNNQMFKKNMSDFMVTLYNISQMDLDYTAIQTKVLTEPLNFINTIQPIVIGKNVTLTLNTNKSGFQTCKVEKMETMPF